MRLKFLLLFLLSLVAVQPAFAMPAPQRAALEQQLATMIAGRPGDYGIAALDLSNGAIVSINGDRPFPMASTVKLAVAATFLAQVDHGRRSLSDRIGSTTADALMARMLIHSDNGATDQLLRNLGGPATVQTWMAFNGLSGIRIDRTIAQLLRDRRDLSDIRDSSTPHSMLALLRTVDSGKVLKPASRSYLLSLMARCMTGRNRIRALLPASTRVEHKTGTLDGLSDDVGFITLPDGRRIAVAIFARGGTNRPQTIAQAARSIYDGFVGAWSNSFTPTFSAP